MIKAGNRSYSLRSFVLPVTKEAQLARGVVVHHFPLDNSSLSPDLLPQPAATTTTTTTWLQAKVSLIPGVGTAYRI